MKLEHPNALKLKEVADKYLAWNTKSFPDDAKMLECGKKDYENFISIAQMIEDNEFDNKAIGRAISDLDTFVRDYIPNDIYDLYCG
jgi:hypothetical protein